MSQNRLPLIAGILIFDQVEVLDVAGPFEVFSITRLNEERRMEEPSECNNELSATGAAADGPATAADDVVGVAAVVVEALASDAVSSSYAVNAASRSCVAVNDVYSDDDAAAVAAACSSVVVGADDLATDFTIDSMCCSS